MKASCTLIMAAALAAPAAAAEVVVGLDVGTTGTKAVAFGIGSPWRHTVVREYPLLAPNPGWQVQDPATVVAAVMGALAEVGTASRGARVLGISVSTAMHGLIGLDEGLRPLTPLITWADSRAAAEAAEAIGVSPDFFNEHVRHELRWVRRGRKVLVAVTEVQRWLDENAERTLE